MCATCFDESHGGLLKEILLQVRNSYISVRVIITAFARLSDSNEIT